jgi:predicted RNA-binding Zn ribbon-like protein
MQAANAPIPQLAAMVSALRIGIRPENSALANMASSARTLALLRMLEAGMRDGFDDPMRASQWASMAKVSGEILSDVGSPEADFNSKLQDIALKTEEAPVPLLGVLSGGQHTANMETEDDSEERTSGGSRGGPGSPSEAPPSR